MGIDAPPSIIASALKHRLPPRIDYGIAFIGCGGSIDYSPTTSARDNLGTLRVVEAAYRSMHEMRSVNPAEIVAE